MKAARKPIRLARISAPMESLLKNAPPGSVPSGTTQTPTNEDMITLHIPLAVLEERLQRAKQRASALECMPQAAYPRGRRIRVEVPLIRIVKPLPSFLPK